MITVRNAFWSAVIAAFVFAAVFAAVPVQAAPAATAGMVDFDYLVKNHPDLPKADAAFRAVQEAAKKEFEQKSAGLGDKEKLELDGKIKQQVEQKRRELLQPILTSIDTAIKEVAEAQGLTMVVHKNTVAWGGPDITEDVLKKITGK